jgi:bifunctional UDP-N-acetylglucosamine pyrophosphorylase/glucosamine-1-phosphate N-acetyltransferase
MTAAAKESPLAAVVLAAGLGTRMNSARAKVLHQIGGEPLIGRALRAIAPLNPWPVIVVVGYQADEVADAARRALANATIRFARQLEPRGTGDALRCALKELAADFHRAVLIVYGDLPALRPETIEAFRRAHCERHAPLSFISVELIKPGGYGRVIRSGTGDVEAIVEARDASPVQRALKEINTGVYLADADFLRSAIEELKPDTSQGEYYLTDLVAIARRRGLPVLAWRGDNPHEFAGVNTREELARMERENRERINAALMARGVTLVDPMTAYIGEQVEIGADTVIGPNVQIIGQSKLGAGVRIEGTAYLSDVTIGAGCLIKLGVRAEECEIGPNCDIGPFANLRAGTILAGDNRIGNFVETKQARIGRGTKASHLSYLGDAVIGSETNVGCGVITVNYDGYDKHLTQIGDRCMIGCDTQLVAPVKVGSDVYVASGTTILQEVEDGALVMSHHPQRKKPGWMMGWRKRHEKADAHTA